LLPTEAAGYPVQVRLYKGGILWKSVPATVQPDGSYSIITRVFRIGYWAIRAYFPATLDDKLEARMSASRILLSYKIRPRVWCFREQTLIRSGDAVSVSGRVSPSFTGRKIVIQRQVSGRWSTLATCYLKTSRSTYYRALWLKTGYYRIRGYFPAGRDNYAAASRPRWFVVYAPALSRVTTWASPKYPARYSYVTAYARTKDQYGRALGGVYVRSAWHYKAGTRDRKSVV